jgi:uncharacterized Rmd1/YagE family protein
LIGSSACRAFKPKDSFPRHFPRIRNPASVTYENSSMFERLFANKNHVRIRALLVGDRLDLHTLKTAEQLAAQPLTVPVAEQGCAVLYRYGAVVLFDVPPLAEAAFLKQLQPFVVEPVAEIETETLDVRVGAVESKEGLEKGALLVRELSLERFHVIADVLAKSVALADDEKRISATFDQVEPLAVNLEQGGAGTYQVRMLTRHIGHILLTQHRMVGRVEVGEKPEILWEKPDLEVLYVRLEDEYELHERQRALERKLEVIGRTAETVLDLLQARRSLRVEWYIVILIVMELLLSLYDKFLK